MLDHGQSKFQSDCLLDWVRIPVRLAWVGRYQLVLCFPSSTQAGLACLLFPLRPLVPYRASHCSVRFAHPSRREMSRSSKYDARYSPGLCFLPLPVIEVAFARTYRSLLCTDDSPYCTDSSRLTGHWYCGTGSVASENDDSFD